MTIEISQFRIIRDPKDARLWAYEPLAHHAYLPIIGGFKTPEQARRAFERQCRKASQ